MTPIPVRQIQTAATNWEIIAWLYQKVTKSSLKLSDDHNACSLFHKRHTHCGFSTARVAGEVASLRLRWSPGNFTLTTRLQEANATGLEIVWQTTPSLNH